MIFTKLKNLINEIGFWPALWLLLNRLMQKLSKHLAVHHYYFYSQPLQTPPPKKLPRPSPNRPRRPAPYQFEWHAAWDEKMESENFPRPRHVLNERFAQATEALLALKDDKLVGCAWFSYGQYREDEVRCIYRFEHIPHAVWDYDIYIVPEMRMGRLFMRLWTKCSEDLAGKGYQQSLSRIDSANAISVRSHEKLGAKRIGWAWFLNLGSGQITVSSCYPYANISLRRSRVPVLHISIG